MTESSLWDSMSSTQTLIHVRRTASGTWRTALLLFCAFVLWVCLEPGGVLEMWLSPQWRTWVETHRLWMGPILSVPIVLSGLLTLRRIRRQPMLPGRPTVWALLGLTLLVFIGLVPWQVTKRQSDYEAQARRQLLPLGLQLVQAGSSLPGQAPGWFGQPVPRQVDDPIHLVVVDLPWLPGGGLGISASGQISSLR